MPDVRGDDGRDSRIEVVIAVVLSVSGLMTSWASYQASLWDGEQAAHYSRANALRVMSSSAELEADARRAVEISLYSGWLEAYARGDGRLADFYEERFPPELRVAFRAWIALKPMKNPSAPPGPFVMQQYKPSGVLKAERLDREAEAAFGSGEKANSTSDLFTQGVVFLSSAMFFGGIGQVFRTRSVRLGLLGIAVVACVAGVVRILTLPALAPG